MIIGRGAILPVISGAIEEADLLDDSSGVDYFKGDRMGLRRFRV